ncbi:MAG: phage tail tape measure protein, partial [Anaerolineae bacterium UTCFX5]
LKQFGLGIEDAAGTADVLVRAAGSSSATVGDLAQGFQNVGPVANMFGMSVEETAAALAVLAENGIKGAEGGTAMKAMLLNLARPTKKTQDALNDLGVSLYDADGNFRDLDSVIDDLDFALDGLPMDEQIYYSEALAGSYGITAFNALRAAGGIDEMQDSMLNATGAGDVAEARMQGFAGALEQLKGSFETLMIQAFTPFMDNFLTPMINKIVPIVNEIGNWIAANPELVSSIGQLVIGGALLAVVMGILGTVLKVAFGPAGKLAVALGAAAVFINGMETGNLLVLAVGIAAVGVATGFLMGKKFVPFGIALAGVAAIINGIQAGRFGEVAVGIGAIGVAVGLATGSGKLFAFGIALGALGLVVNGIESQDMLQVAVGIAALSASVAVITGSPKVLLLGAAIGLLGVIVDGFNTGNMLQVSVGLVALGAAIAIFAGVGNVFVLGVALGALALVVDGFNTGSLTKMGIGIGALGTAVSLALGSGRLFGLSIILGGMAFVVEGFDTDNVFLIAAGLTAVGVGAWAAFGPVGLLAAAIAGLALAISLLVPGIVESWGRVFNELGKMVQNVINLVDQLLEKLGIAGGVEVATGGFVGDPSTMKGGTNSGANWINPGETLTPFGLPQRSTGLGYVPWDGYIASLHQGERVLTRREARDYNMGGDGGPINVYVTAYGSNPAEFGEMVRRELRGLAR